MLNAGMTQADGGYQPPQVPNAWQGFQEPIVIQILRDPLLQKLLLPYGEADEPPPFQAFPDPSKPAAPKKKKKILPRIQGPPEAVDHHRDAVPQLHENILNRGKHGRQLTTKRKLLGGKPASNAGFSQAISNLVFKPGI
jgi:hypothetical protein